MSAGEKRDPIVSDGSSVATNPVLNISLKWPILTGLVLLVIALFFKWIDTFVLRLDERLGEIILCKALGFVLVVVFVWVTGRTLRDIGLHSRRLGASLLIGAGVAVTALIVGYGVEFALQLANRPAFFISAVDPKTEMQGGLLFALWLILGNVVNASMEEGLFRGVMVRLFRVKLRPWPANALQAFLFGLWHLPWVLKWYQIGELEAHGGLFLAALGQFMPMLLVGLAWGYFYIKTDSLWVPWIGHLLNNTVLNVLHITTAGGVESGASIRGPVCMVVTLLGMVVVKVVADRLRFPEVKPWGQWTVDGTAT
jgi:membrane protease YdiL (CAAX protease family)